MPEFYKDPAFWAALAIVIGLMGVLWVWGEILFGPAG